MPCQGGGGGEGGSKKRKRGSAKTLKKEEKELHDAQKWLAKFERWVVRGVDYVE